MKISRKNRSWISSQVEQLGEEELLQPILPPLGSLTPGGSWVIIDEDSASSQRHIGGAVSSMVIEELE